MIERTHETSRLNPGQNVSMAGFLGTVVRLYSDGPCEGGRMYEVRLPGGLGCFCGSDLIPLDKGA